VPQLIVLGGSRAFGYSTETSDYDYYGYHTKINDDILIKIGDPEALYINSCAMTDFDKQMMENDYIGTYTITNWLVAQVIYESTEAQEFRVNTVIPYVQKNRDLIVNMIRKTAYERGRAFTDGSTGLFYDRDEYPEIPLHLGLMAYHLEQTGEIEGNLNTLLSTYNISLNTILGLNDIVGLSTQIEETIE
jgi:hypothetical protein